MEVDWVRHQLAHYVDDGRQVLQRLSISNSETTFLEQALRFLIRYLEIPRQVATQDLDEIMVRIAYTCGGQALPCGYWNQMSFWWPQIKTIAETLPDPELKAEIIKQLAIVKNLQGNTDEAQGLYEQLITSSYFGLLSGHKQADILHQAGVCYLRKGKYTQAKGMLNRCLTVSKRHGQWEIAAYALNQLGSLAMVQGKLDKAYRLYDECLHTFESHGEGNNLVCIAHQSLGRLLVLQGCYSEAILFLKQGLAIRSHRQDLDGIAHCQIYLAAAYLEWGRFDEVESLLNEALQICRDLQDQRGIVFCYFVFGRLEEKQGYHEAAITQWKQALEVLGKMPVPAVELLVLAVLLPQLLRAGRVREALPIVTQLFVNLRVQQIGPNTIWRYIVQNQRRVRGQHCVNGGVSRN